MAPKSLFIASLSAALKVFWFVRYIRAFFASLCKLKACVLNFLNAMSAGTNFFPLSTSARCSGSNWFICFSIALILGSSCLTPWSNKLCPSAINFPILLVGLEFSLVLLVSSSNAWTDGSVSPYFSTKNARSCILFPSTLFIS